VDTALSWRHEDGACRHTPIDSLAAVVTVQLHGVPPARVTAPVQTPVSLAGLDVLAKTFLAVALVLVLLDPSWANLEGKAPVARVILFPVWASVVPVLWTTRRRSTPFPWSADLLVTLTCVLDLVGNRHDLYDSIDWFDDAMHLLNAALVSAAFLMLFVRRTAGVLEIREAAVAVGMTASLAWELFEFATFLTRSTEWTSAYEDTIGDLVLGWVGSVVAALVIGRLWQDQRSARRPSSVGTLSSHGVPPRRLASDVPEAGRGD